MNGKRLVVISIDSMADDDLQYASTLPVFGKLMREGSRVQSMLGVYPSLTYPVHASIITGVSPMTHGVYNNEILSIGPGRNDWFWYQRDIKAPTVIDAAKAKGHTAATVFYPCMGASVADYTIPEIWTEFPEEDPRPLFEKGTSPNIMQSVFDKNRPLLHWKYQENFDEFSCACIVDILKMYKPEVLFGHMSLVDHTRHSYGVQNEHVQYAVRKSDEYLGRIMDAMREAGTLAETNFFVVSDHGQRRVDQQVSPNVFFLERGLITVDENGEITDWKAYSHSASLSAQIYVKDPSDAALMREVRAVLDEMQADPRFGVETVLDADTLRERYKLTGPFSFMIEGREGTAFRSRWRPPLVCEVDPAVPDDALLASHGHMPEKGIQPIFLAWGPDIKEGVVVPRGSVLDEAPTFAKVMGLSMPTCEGRPIDALLR